ncbi:predicted protein [Histoplasma capsulatum var. duboisii H88]|uniref:Predicted protein n=1 Tax=Ajellomyces capsulatus (strain H88) TaxID=544711 RepID=F0UDJ6_AJEC8|nr:predicted protein [Histoplasma capsulatum var. duboisii H88]
MPWKTRSESTPEGRAIPTTITNIDHFRYSLPVSSRHSSPIPKSSVRDSMRVLPKTEPEPNRAIVNLVTKGDITREIHGVTNSHAVIPQKKSSNSKCAVEKRVLHRPPNDNQAGFL